MCPHPEQVFEVYSSVHTITYIYIFVKENIEKKWFGNLSKKRNGTI
jgi:hypothetical protein